MKTWRSLTKQFLSEFIGGLASFRPVVEAIKEEWNIRTFDSIGLILRPISRKFNRKYTYP